MHNDEILYSIFLALMCRNLAENMSELYRMGELPSNDYVRILKEQQDVMDKLMLGMDKVVGIEEVSDA